MGFSAKIKRFGMTLLALSLTAIPFSVHAVPGDLDTTFSTDGIVTTPIGTSFDEVYGMEIQPDGKVIVGGTMRTSSGSDDFALARYNVDGTLDATFGGGDGIVTTNLGSSDSLYALHLLPSGQILAAGVTDRSGTDDFALVRYNSDGTLDSSFGSEGNGIVITDIIDYIQVDEGVFIEQLVHNTARGLVVLSDGSIVLTGHAGFGGSYNFALVKYSEDGVQDMTFGTDRNDDDLPEGNTITNIGLDDLGWGSTVDADDNILLVGSSDSIMAAARYLPNGALDTTFGGGDGIVTSNPSASTERAVTAVVEPDGDILIGGSNSTDSILWRYLRDGSVDTSFNTTGFTVRDLSVPAGNGFPDTDLINDIVLQSDGQILVAGFRENGAVTTRAAMVARFNTNGSLDTTFGAAGTGAIRTDVGTAEDHLRAITLRSNGVIVAAGFHRNTSNNNDFLVVQYEGDNGPNTPADSGPTAAFESASQSSVNESGSLNVNVALSEAVGTDVTIPFSLSGTATQNTDYTITASPLVITAGETRGSITVTITNDGDVESNETVIITLGSPTGADLASPSAHTLTITNDDIPQSLTASNPSVAETAGTATITLTLAVSPSSAFTVAYSTFSNGLPGSATPGSDFTAVPSGAVVFNTGQTTQTVTIPILNDSTTESSETFAVNFLSDDGLLETSSVVTIQDDDFPRISVTNATVSEAAGTVTLTISLPSVSVAPNYASYSTSNGSATSGADYTAVPLTFVTFSPGETSKDVVIPILEDVLVEGTETFSLNVVAVDSFFLGPLNPATITITDNDEESSTGGAEEEPLPPEPEEEISYDCPSGIVVVTNAVTNEECCRGTFGEDGYFSIADCELSRMLDPGVDGHVVRLLIEGICSSGVSLEKYYEAEVDELATTQDVLGEAILFESGETDYKSTLASQFIIDQVQTRGWDAVHSNTFRPSCLVTYATDLFGEAELNATGVGGALGGIRSVMECLAWAKIPPADIGFAGYPEISASILSCSLTNEQRDTLLETVEDQCALDADEILERINLSCEILPQIAVASAEQIAGDEITCQTIESETSERTAWVNVTHAMEPATLQESDTASATFSRVGNFMAIGRAEADYSAVADANHARLFLHTLGSMDPNHVLNTEGYRAMHAMLGGVSLSELNENAFQTLGNTFGQVLTSNSSRGTNLTETGDVFAQYVVEQYAAGAFTDPSMIVNNFETIYDTLDRSRHAYEECLLDPQMQPHCFNDIPLDQLESWSTTAP